jgi:hypothetical protein
MKKNIFILVVLVCFQMNAQSFSTVKVPVKDGYRTFLSLENKSFTEKNQDGWDFAVIDERHEIGAEINEYKGVKLWKVFRDTTAFNSITILDTTFRSVNSTQYLYLGAFDSTYLDNTSSVLNPYYQLGLGKMYSSNYFCYGDKCYIIQCANGEFGKMYLSSYKNVNNERIYTFRYAKIDGTQDGYFQVKKTTTFTKHHTYVNLTNKSYATNFEMDNANSWDLVFSSYETKSGNVVAKKPMGAFLNNGVLNISISEISGRPSGYDIPTIYTQAYDAIGTPSTLSYDKRFEGFKLLSKKQDQIQTKWMDANGDLTSNFNFFVKSNAGTIFHIYFSGLDKVNNTVDVNIKRVSSAIENIAKNNSYQFENKANSMKVFSNAIDEKNFNVTVFDLMGRTIATAETQNGEILMDKTSWGSSLVIVQVKNNQNIINYKLATLN